jgi:hypothetical protein
MAGRRGGEGGPVIALSCGEDLECCFECCLSKDEVRGGDLAMGGGELCGGGGGALAVVKLLMVSIPEAASSMMELRRMLLMLSEMA